MCDGFLLTKCSFNLVLSFHAERVNGMEAFVQSYLRVKGRARQALAERGDCGVSHGDMIYCF